jgi:deoxyribose-phosphate aldolase
MYAARKPDMSNIPPTAAALAQYIDHTLLDQGAQHDVISAAAQVAVDYGMMACCVRANHLPWIIDTITPSAIRPCAAIGFRLLSERMSRNPTQALSYLPAFHIDTAEKIDEIAKVFQAVQRLPDQRPVEFDICPNFLIFLREDPAKVEQEIRILVEYVREESRRFGRPAVVKIITENYLLPDEKIRSLCLWVKAAGADFVKTATGFTPVGATLEGVRLMRECVGPDMGIKAAGGVTQFTYQQFLEAGVDRIGTSKGKEILDQFLLTYPEDAI